MRGLTPPRDPKQNNDIVLVFAKPERTKDVLKAGPTYVHHNTRAWNSRFQSSRYPSSCSKPHPGQHACTISHLNEPMSSNTPFSTCLSFCSTLIELHDCSLGSTMGCHTIKEMRAIKDLSQGRHWVANKTTHEVTLIFDDGRILAGELGNEHTQTTETDMRFLLL